MREACIIMPKRTNEGSSLNWLAAVVERRLAETFGGFTRDEAEGGWIEGQFMQKQGVWRYIIAYNPKDLALNKELRDIAELIGWNAKEISVYYRLANGSVHFARTSAREAREVA